MSTWLSSSSTSSTTRARVDPRGTNQRALLSYCMVQFMSHSLFLSFKKYCHNRAAVTALPTHCYCVYISLVSLSESFTFVNDRKILNKILIRTCTYYTRRRNNDRHGSEAYASSFFKQHWRHCESKTTLSNMTTSFATLPSTLFCDQRNQEDEIYLTPLLAAHSTESIIMINVVSWAIMMWMASENVFMAHALHVNQEILRWLFTHYFRHPLGR